MKTSNIEPQKIPYDNDMPVRVDITSGKGITLIPSYHADLEFQLIRNGKGQYFIDGINYPITKDSIYIMHTNKVHNFIAEPDSHVERINLIVSPKVFNNQPIAETLLKELKNINHLRFTPKQASQAELILTEIMEECKHKDNYWQNNVQSNLIKFLILLYRSSKTAAVAKSMKTNPLIQKIICYIDKNYADDLSLVEVAAKFYISSCNLSRIFKGYVGMGFKEYIIHRRILEAKKLLENTDMKVMSIAYEVGFDNLSTFNRDFKILIGFSPSSYRKFSSQVDTVL